MRQNAISEGVISEVHCIANGSIWSPDICGWNLYRVLGASRARNIDIFDIEVEMSCLNFGPFFT